MTLSAAFLGAILGFYAGGILGAVLGGVEGLGGLGWGGGCGLILVPFYAAGGAFVGCAVGAASGFLGGGVGGLTGQVGGPPTVKAIAGLLVGGGTGLLAIMGAWEVCLRVRGPDKIMAVLTDPAWVLPPSSGLLAIAVGAGGLAGLAGSNLDRAADLLRGKG